jgi:acyl-CoA synthetase (NDP forming)
VIGAVVEGFRDGAKFVEVARRAMTAGKPLVVLKIGRSEYGERAAASHTAALAGDDAVTDAVFDQYGVIRADDIPDLCDTVSMLAMRRPNQPAGKLCVYSFSGGTASLAADISGYHGLEVAALSDGTVAELRRIAPEYGLLDNPVDLTTDIFTNPGLNVAALESIVNDDAVDVVLLCVPADYGASTEKLCREAVDVVGSSCKMLVPVWMSPDHCLGYRALEEAGLLPYPSVTDAVRALARLRWWDSRSESQPSAGAASAALSGVQLDTDPLTAGMGILAAAGIAVPDGQLVRDAAAAAAAAAEIGYPVAMKIADPAIAHKSEHGGVRVGVRNESEVRTTFSELWSIPTPDPGGNRAVQVQAMIKADVELILGFHRDPVFGPVVTIGSGGIYAEYDKDVTQLRPPFTAGQVITRLRSLRVWARLTGARGRPELDPEAIARAVADFGALCADGSNPLNALEVNPLVVLRPASTPAAADKPALRLVALDVLAEPQRRSHV